jgi:hypothetical protein
MMKNKSVWDNLLLLKRLNEVNAWKIIRDVYQGLYCFHSNGYLHSNLNL